MIKFKSIEKIAYQYSLKDNIKVINEIANRVLADGSKIRRSSVRVLFRDSILTRG